MEIVITGASKGLGLSCSIDALNEAENSVIPISRTHGYDVTIPADMDRVAREVSPEALICCAGIYGPHGYSDCVDRSRFRDCIQVNFMGVVNACNAFVPGMKKRSRGKIVIISGGGATKAMPGFSAYASSKAAVVRYAECLAMELIDYGIDVNCVAPGMLPTDMTREVCGLKGPWVNDLAIEARNCLDSDDSMEEPLALIRFLCSRESDGITGRLISAKWDDWRSLRHDNMKPDQFKLRRVV